MPNHDDSIVLMLIVAIIIIWGFYGIKRWLVRPKKLKLPFASDTTIPTTGQAVRLLEANGYQVLHGKYRLPITIDLNGKKLYSRYFIDYFVRKDNRIFVVKCAKERQPISMTGSSIREHLLPYFLLFEEVSGVIYLDVGRESVHEISFQLNEDDGG